MHTLMDKMRIKPELRFVAIFLFFCGFFLILIFAASIIVDPRGIFGTGLIRPVVLTNRTEKLEKLAAKNPSPDIIILGSSRVFKMDPSLINELTGLQAYNASVSYARPEEYLALTQYIMNDLKIKPKIFAVGFNVGEFNNEEMDAQTIMNPRLRKYLPINTAMILKTTIKVFKETVNPLYLRDMGLALFWSSMRYPNPQVTFNKNGKQEFDKNELHNLERVKQIDPALRLFNGFDALSQERKKYFQSFAALAKKSGVQVIAFIVPMPEIALESLQKNTHYNDVYRDLLAFLKELERKNLIIAYDFSSVAKFNGFPDSFDDSTHPGYENLDLITRIMFGKTDTNRIARISQ